MKKFILSVAIVLGMTLLSYAQDDLFGFGGGGEAEDTTESAFKSVYKDGEYIGSILQLDKYISTFTPAGKETEPNITCVHTSNTVTCY